MESNRICEVNYLYYWKNGYVSCEFVCHANGYREVKSYKTKAAAKCAETKFINRCIRIYG